MARFLIQIIYNMSRFMRRVCSLLLSAFEPLPKEDITQNEDEVLGEELVAIMRQL